MNTYPQVRTDDIVVQRSGSEVLVYDLRNSKAYCLNETCSQVYKLCNGKRSIDELTEELKSKIDPSISTDYVNLALDQLGRDGLLETGLGETLDRVSRRGIIRRVGFASLIALPVVSSLTAPVAAQTLSCLPNGPGSCLTTPCCSGNCVSGTTPVARCCHTGFQPPALFPGIQGCVPTGTCPTAAECCSGLGTPAPGGACAPGTENCECAPY